MSLRTSVSSASASILALALLACTAHAQITIPTVVVANPGNPTDPFTGNLYGSVPYTYNIGTTEVTNAQYTAFLNAVARTDTNNLYNPSMGGTFGGIVRLGASGAYTYASVSGRENNPVNFVSFWDATRFANWLHNGQPTGTQNNSTTENGAYTLTAAGISANSITRNASALWAVTSENEWYKAAFHQPTSQGGPASNYWLFPNSGNTISTAQANYNNVVGNTIPVRSYTPNFYGTYDMGGNVFEWTEYMLSSSRGIRGGTFDSTFIGNLRADGRYINDATNEFNVFGFRVSQIPGSIACRPDFNNSGYLEVQDIFGFLAAWFAGDPRADFNGNGLSVQDIFDFLGAWFAGC